MNKTAIKNYAIWARVQLIEAAKQKAFEYGITESGPNDPNLDTIGGCILTVEEKEQRSQLISQIKLKGYTQVMEEVAYTWFNRFIALRFMEVNGYLPSKIRVFTDENNTFKPEIMKEAMHIELDGLDKDKVQKFIDEQNNEELYKYLLITQCNALGDGLPYVFEEVANWTELLFPNNLLKVDSVIGRMISDIDVDDWADEVEIIGWLYQYYISEKHEEVVDPLHGKSVKKEDIPAATQLFTTDWVVRYILDNSLGRYWIERHPESQLASKLTYFVMPKEGKLETINESVKPEELKVLDPCVGSGHFLSYAFDILMEIYRESGWLDRDAAKSIIENNLFGLDIDDRAAQLACFAVLMKARKFNRGIISSISDLHIMAMHESAEVSYELIQFVAKNDKTILNDLDELRRIFYNAKEYGSILKIQKIDFVSIYNSLEEIKNEYYGNILDMALQKDAIEKLLPLLKQAEILSNKYEVVVTNPPYLNKFSTNLKNFVNEEYADYKGDLFSVFMYRNFDFCKANGYSGFMTPNVWMFIKTYEELRNYIIKQKAIVSLIQMAKGAFFKEATVDICAFVLKNSNERGKGLYFRLEGFKGDMEVQKHKVIEAIKDRNCGYYYETSEDNFSKIPGSPIAYWVSVKMFKLLAKEKIINISNPCLGMRTGNNDKYLRLWHEVDINRTSCLNLELYSNKKWLPYNKGGGFRRWYGMNEYLVNWENDGYEIKESTRSKYGENIGWKITNEKFYFMEGITWGSVTSGITTFRYYPKGYIFSNCGQAVIMNNNDQIMNMIGYLNTLIVVEFLKILAPTIGCESGYVAKLPYIKEAFNNRQIKILSEKNVSIAKIDWNYFETSWDFERHPLV